MLAWFQPIRPELFTIENYPAANIAADEGRYYAYPCLGFPDSRSADTTTSKKQRPRDDLDRVCRDEDEEILRLAVAKYFPDANGPTLSMKVCMFTNTPDEHFIIDALPGIPNVFIAAGFSGHGFKFLQRGREIMSDLATTGETAHDISLLSLSRFEELI